MPIDVREFNSVWDCGLCSWVTQIFAKKVKSTLNDLVCLARLLQRLEQGSGIRAVFRLLSRRSRLCSVRRDNFLLKLPLVRKARTISSALSGHWIIPFRILTYISEQLTSSLQTVIVFTYT